MTPVWIEAMSTSTPAPPPVSLTPTQATDHGEVRAKLRPGRPRKVRLAPTHQEADYLGAINALRAKHVAGDPVANLFDDQGRPADPSEVVHRLVVALAREAAGLKFDRIEGEKAGRNMEQTSSRRVDALGKAAHLLIDARRLGLLGFDPRGQAMQRVAALWLDEVRMVAGATLSPDAAKVLLAKLTAAMVGWEDQVGFRTPHP